MTRQDWYLQFSRRGISKGTRSYGEYEAAKTVIMLYSLTSTDYEQAIQYAAEYVGV